MIGQRLPDVNRSKREGWENWDKEPGHQLVAKPGSYMKVLKEDGSLWCWYIVAPNGQACSLFEPTHKVEEHSDGTITVSPSIVTTHNNWHGFLHQGIWT